MKKMITVLFIVLALFVSCDLTFLHETYITGDDAFDQKEEILIDKANELPDDGIYRFIVVADPHYGREEVDSGVERDETNYYALLNEMNSVIASDKDALMPLLVLGDVVDSGRKDSYEKSYDFLKKSHDACPEMPILYTCGNHELESSNVEDWEAYFTKNPSDFIHNGKNMLHLTGNYGMGDKVSIYNLNSAYRIFGGKQLRNLESALREDDAEYKLFLSHIPLGSEKINQTLFEFIIGDERERNEMLRLMDLYGRSFMLTGHHHMGDTLNNWNEHSKEFIFSAFHTRHTPFEGKGRWYIYTLDTESGKCDIYGFDFYTPVTMDDVSNPEKLKGKTKEYWSFSI